MAQLDDLLREYKEAHGAGSGDPRPFLSRASAADRAVLAALIEAYLENAPRRWRRESSGRSPEPEAYGRRCCHVCALRHG